MNKRFLHQSSITSDLHVDLLSQQAKFSGKNSSKISRKVLMVNTAKNRGGAARIASILTKNIYQHREDFDARLIHFDDAIENEPFIGIRKLWVRYFLALQSRLIGSYRAHDFGVSTKILQYAKKADIIHFHNLHGYYVNYGRLVRSLPTKPIVWTWHDMWGVTGRCGFSGDCRRWEKYCTPCPHKELYPAAWLDNSSREYSDKFSLFYNLPNLHIVCPSQWLADIAIKRGYRKKQITVIPNPINTEEFQKFDRRQARRLLGLPKDTAIALFIAENCNDPRKGYPDFCAATYESDYYSIALGLPPANPAPHVAHMGRIVDRDKLSQYYSAADVMVIPSYADNYPTTVIEALVSGTPVIGYDEGGIASQLTHSFCAVTPKGQIQKLRRALNSFASNIEEARKYSSDIAVQSSMQWSCSTITDLYCDVYRKIQNLVDSQIVQ